MTLENPYHWYKTTSGRHCKRNFWRKKKWCIDTRNENYLYIMDLCYSLTKDELVEYKRAFTNQKLHAKARNIEFRMNFIEWLNIWLQLDENGTPYIHNRGRFSENYVMMRHNDEGPYTSDNVSIGTVFRNVSDGTKKKVCKT